MPSKYWASVEENLLFRSSNTFFMDLQPKLHKSASFWNEKNIKFCLLIYVLTVIDFRL